jgi:hypothetical protein
MSKSSYLFGISYCIYVCVELVLSLFPGDGVKQGTIDDLGSKLRVGKAKRAHHFVTRH